jgi:hypothetical protein
LREDKDKNKHISALIFNYKEYENPSIDLENLRDLAYIVYPLPETMKQLVWDFGSVTDADEIAYIKAMLDKSEIAKLHDKEAIIR